MNHSTTTNQSLDNIKIRLPTIFDGRTSHYCNMFFSQLSIYFAANSPYNTTEDRKIMLAISCVLSGRVFTFLEPFISQIDKPDILSNYDVFKAQIIAAFGDSGPFITAKNHLRRLKQDNQSSIATYATKFRMYAQVVQWNDAALISSFKVNLNSII
ncbi:hypothetical protein PS15p_209212 [Mucor circinelloides]